MKEEIKKVARNRKRNKLFTVKFSIKKGNAVLYLKSNKNWEQWLKNTKRVSQSDATWYSGKYYTGNIRDYHDTICASALLVDADARFNFAIFRIVGISKGITLNMITPLPLESLKSGLKSALECAKAEYISRVITAKIQIEVVSE